MVSIYPRDASMLFDPRSNYSYVLLYFAPYLDMPYGSLNILVHVSTPVGDSIMVDRVYRSCMVNIGGYETRVDNLLLNMVDLDVILGMDWLSLYHAILGCHTKIVTLAMPMLPRLEWRGSLGHTPSRAISFLKAQQMVEKGCLAHLAFVRHVSVDTATIGSFPVVREFPDIFHVVLAGMPPDRDIDFGIDFVTGTQSISIALYRMALSELKE
ncbi:uncharacterized protein [Nicotiana tomentosiformis]|uniref:uncharacterized protein n=1 Tax=Nicotiana tomentosiformis TaxID=4098 RepID=UPI00388CC00A